MEGLLPTYPVPKPWPAPGAAGAAPAGLRTILEAAEKDGRALFFGSKTPDGYEWKPDQKRKEAALFTAKHATSSSKRWRVECEVEGVTVEAILAASCDMENKLSWDKSLTWTRHISRYTMDGCWADVEAYTTAAAAAGLISSRLFIDGRITKVKRTESGEMTSVLCATTNLHKDMPDADKIGVVELEKCRKKTSLVRARNFSGGGLHAEKIPGKDAVKMILVCHMEIGGYLPSAIVNSASADAILDTTIDFIKEVKRQPNRKLKEEGERI
ncbi:hypothetical protein DIPPA_08349 [Diplonema papillatum]|nr:hypothetical protein DIPPA_08349 [Diplonema papillatum]|eukprot:gene19412-29907_t